jgi:hypothetical protein
MENGGEVMALLIAEIRTNREDMKGNYEATVSTAHYTDSSDNAISTLTKTTIFNIEVTI